jgi:hypothetical protein
MKKLALTSAFALAFAFAPSASAQLVSGTTLTPTAPTLGTTTTTNLTTWKGEAGTYEVFAPLSAERQAVELRGAIKPSEANPNLPETLIKLPAYKPGVEALPYGYGTTDLVATAKLSEACPTGATPITSYTRNWSRSATYGNSTFGSGYLARFTLGMNGVAGSNDRLYAEGVARANVTVFGATGWLEGRAYGQVQNTTASHDLSMKIQGATVWQNTGAASLSYANSWTRTLASASTLIWVGPVPVRVSGSASAGLGFNASLGFASSRLTARATPSGNVRATASAGVDLIVASAGIAANLDLIRVSAPLVAGLRLVPASTGRATFGYDVDFDLALSTLSGNVELWAKVWYLFGSKRWSTSIARWSGFSTTYPIVDLHGCAGSFSL